MPIKEQCTHLLDWIGLTGEGEGAQAPEVHPAPLARCWHCS